MGVNFFGPSVNNIVILSKYTSHIIFKSGGINLARIEIFSRMC